MHDAERQSRLFIDVNAIEQSTITQFDKGITNTHPDKSQFNIDVYRIKDNSLGWLYLR